MRLIILPTCVSSPCSIFKTKFWYNCDVSTLLCSRHWLTVFIIIYSCCSLSVRIFLIARPCWGYGSSGQIILELHLYYRTGLGGDYVINLLERGRVGWSFRDIITQNCFICGDLNSRYEAGLHDWQLTRFSLLCVRSGLGRPGSLWGVVTVCWWCLQTGCCGHHLRPDGPRTAPSQYCDSVTVN